ncbi:MAG: ribosome-associated translation inhibitor RaiA [Crocinitomicaceae bacterium]|jgi:putative sigma-54 modulation protein|nr:ribosome-associated translation inhibitor RaiA [Crocinitomicaceae bacterium]MBT5403537.1 ribosome-associated translation inhibitor RaiA [Crocinitomicaceae bacterium]MBT6514970.1 ribosome-associated translation inhibitor RaiA [Crocinitomicaceae bacterium]MDG2330311.1 ribosome-associated translation inhibitor RaiA [Flavobacteriales bacterium]
MSTIVQSIHFDADQDLVNFIESKVSKLNQFYDRIIDSEVYLKVDKNATNENKIAEIRLAIPGKELFAKKQCKTFEEATDLAVEALRRQISKHKGKVAV